MIFPLALALALFAQTPAPRIEDLSERRAFEVAQQALEADESLLGLHRGLRAYLLADDRLRQAEESYDALMELSTLRERVEDFEEVLLADTGARADYQRYVARMQRDPALRVTVEAIGVIEMEPRTGTREFARSFAYLRAHPETAIQFLAQRERGQAGLAALRPLKDAFQRDRLFQTRLREAWTALDALAGAREAVYPWWTRVYGGSTAAAQRYRALHSELAAIPSRRKAWEERELAWAAGPEAAVAWRDHVYARVRRNTVLAPVYFGYLRTLRTHPEVEKYVEETFAVKHGAPPAWPPQGAPPLLPAWQRPNPIERPAKPKNPATPLPGEPSLELPERPAVDRPSTPTQPTTPERNEPGRLEQAGRH